jgi:hypothetical protein
VGNLICSDCGLTFTAQWGSFADADEYRCEKDHVVHVDPHSGAILAVDGESVEETTLVDVLGRCPLCDTELATGRLPSCPVCSGRDHQVILAGTLQ